VSTTSLTVNEGSSNAFGVSLTTAPSANVTATVSSADTNVATVGPGVLTFTPANFATPQNVTVSGAQDLNTMANGTTVTVSAPGMASRTVGVTVTDDDAQSIRVSASNVQVCQGDAVDVLVSLEFSPGGNATVTASIDALRANVAPATLTFTTANFAVPQAVTIFGNSAGPTFLRLSTPGAPDALVGVTVLSLFVPACMV
jgi:hypothetical protein